MEQTFNDLCRDRVESEKGLLGFALWMFIETFTGVVREHVMISFRRNRNVVLILLGAGSVLLLPLVAMQFTGEVAWTAGDFVFAFVILAVPALTYELVVRKTGNFAYRAAAGIALAGAFLLVWSNGAVGIIGSEDDDINLMYNGVLAAGIAGALIARFRPHGMMRALVATALAQALVTVIALIAGKHEEPTSSVAEIVNINAFFIALWVGSALLFQRASGTGSQRKPTA